MSPLRIHLLQSPSVYWGTSLVPIQRRASRHLLFYLACQPECDRAGLCTLFWPDLLDEEARPLLRSTLSKLRTALPDPSLVVTVGETVNLDQHRTWVDVQEFRGLAKAHLRTALQIPIHLPLPDGLAQNLRRAANLWTTNEIWPGADFFDQPELEDWLRDLRQDSTFDFQRILERLAFNAAANGDLELALARARRVVQVDPLNDDMHMQTCQWLLALGKRSTALEYCNSVQDLYERQSIPVPEQMVQLCATASAAKPQAPSSPADPWLRSVSTSLAFIRRPEMEQVFRQAVQRGGRLWLSGEAGTGKTRLMYEVARTLDPAPRLLLVNSHPSAQNLPYQAWINALRRQVRQEEWLKLEPVWVTQLARLLPELAVLRPGIEAPFQPDTGDTALFEALHQLMLVLARPNKLLLILDDAQWYDPTSLSTVSYLCNHGFFNQHGLLVISHRPAEETPALHQLISTPFPRLPGASIKLECFSQEEINQLIQRILGQTPSDRTTHLLLRETGGNPLFLIESLYLLLDQGMLDINQIGESLPLSGNLHTLANQRVQRLSPTARQVIGVAAAIGDTFTPGLIEAVGNLRSEQVVQALEELERMHLIQPTLETAHNPIYTFVYSKIREVLLLEMSAARQRMLHLRIAHALEKMPDSAPGTLEATLAEHYEKAGELQAALESWIKAGQHALYLLSPGEAHTALARAERLLLQLGASTPQPTVYQLYSTWNKLAAESTNSELLHAINTRLLEVGERRLDPLLSGAALNGLALSALLTEELDRALHYCDRAEFYLAQTDNLYEKLVLSNMRGDCFILLDQYQDALKAYDNSTCLSDNQTEPLLLALRASAESNISRIYFGMGFPERAREMAQRSLKTSLQAHTTGSALEAYISLVVSEYYLGHLTQAVEYARQGIKLADALQSKQNIAFINLTRARAELGLGLLSESWEHNREAEAIGLDGNLKRVISWSASQRGQTYRFLRQYTLANEAYHAAVENSVFSYDRLEAQFRHGLGLASGEDREIGLELLRATQEKAGRIELDLVSLFAQTAILFSQAYHGAIEDVRQGLPELARRIEGRNLLEMKISLETMQALVAQHDGRLDDAITHARTVIEISARVGHVWWELNSWILLAKLGVEKATFSQRVQQLTGFLRENVQKTPELTGYVRSYIQWVNNEVGYT